MLFITLKKPKIRTFIIIALLFTVLVTAIALPKALSAVNEKRGKTEKEEGYPGEPMRVSGDNIIEDLAVWEDIVSRCGFYSRGFTLKAGKTKCLLNI